MCKSTTTSDHIAQERGKWYFFDESWDDDGRRFDTKEEAENALAFHILYLEGNW